MKNKINIILTAVIALSLAFSSCKKEEFDVTPTFSVPAGDTLLTIAELKAMHSGTLDSIKHNYWIQGVITGNDESGNIYKTIYIQDATGGILLSLNAKSMYLNYKVGQQIYVKLYNLVYGYYGGTPQLGAMYNSSTGQLAEVAIPRHLFKNGFPGSLPAPKIVNGVADLALDKVQTLVQLDSVAFPEAGQPYSLTSATTNRNVTMKDGSTIVLRTSNYATFTDSILPTGRGTIIAILGNFNGTYQLTIRNTNDVFGFSTAIVK
jgi:hypothetical protein